MSTAALSLSQFCERYGVSRSLLNGMIRSGQLAAVRAGRRILITHEAIADWKQASLVQPDAEAK